jgi:Zn-dependent protease
VRVYAGVADSSFEDAAAAQRSAHNSAYARPVPGARALALAVRYGEGCRRGRRRVRTKATLTVPASYPRCGTTGRVLEVPRVREQIQQISLWVLPILVAVVFHEVAHGYVANWFGDSTAKRAGRLTLNPIAHIDPLGSVVIPLFLLLLNSGFLFGWAKPVPVSFAALRNPKRDMIFVAAAGPLMNLLLAVLSAAVFHSIRSGWPEQPQAVSETVLYPLGMIAQRSVLMNVFLGVFNLIPIPPLDGGRVLTGLLPLEWARQFAKIEPFGFPILIVLLMSHSLGALIGRPIRVLLDILL